MKINPESRLADPREAAEFFVRVALEGREPPPPVFAEQVLSGQIVLSDETMNRLVDRGWLPRQRCEVWSRVMGYLRPVSNWNAGKKSEFRERVQLDPHKIIPPSDS